MRTHADTCSSVRTLDTTYEHTYARGHVYSSMRTYADTYSSMRTLDTTYERERARERDRERGKEKERSERERGSCFFKRKKPILNGENEVEE